MKAGNYKTINKCNKTGNSSSNYKCGNINQKCKINSSHSSKFKSKSDNTGNRKRGLAEICVGMFLIVAVCFLVYQNKLNSDYAGETSQSMLDNIQMQIQTHDQTQSTDSLSSPASAVSENLFGVLEFPALSLTLPIQADYSEALLKCAPCRYIVKGGENSKLIICAHNYRSQFGHIRKLVLGDKVLFTDMDGRVFNYTVSQVTTISQSDFAPLKTGGDWDLSLFTCTQNGISRVLVRCQLV